MKRKIYNRKLFTPGGLMEYTSKIMAGMDRKEYTGLSLDEFSRVPQLYSAFDPREISLSELEDDKVYKTKNGDEVLGADIKSMTMLMYLKPRTAYVEYERTKQISTSLHSGAVPYPLLGFKRFWNIPYNSWNNPTLGDAIKFRMISQQDSKKEYTNWKFDEVQSDIKTAFKIDLLLGHTFASTTKDVSGGLRWQPRFGFTIMANRWKQFLPEELDSFTINYLRNHGMGNYRGSWASAYGAANVKLNDDVLDEVCLLYNSCTTPMKLLMARRWVWYEKHRCSDMLCDPVNWDNIPEDVDPTPLHSISTTKTTTSTSNWWDLTI